MNLFSRQGLAVVLGMTTFYSSLGATKAQALPNHFQFDYIETELAPESLEIDTIEQQATGQPIPGTSATSVTALMPVADRVIADVYANSLPREIAQNTTDPEIVFRHDYSYISLGGNVGVKLEQTSLGEAGFVINGKIALAQELSLRPAVIFGEKDTVFLVPITYDITIKDKDPFKEVPYVPFIGGGAVFTTNDNDNAGFLITGGLDYRLSPYFVANASVNVGFIEDSTDIGLILGIGYIIPQKNQ